MDRKEVPAVISEVCNRYFEKLFKEFWRSTESSPQFKEIMRTITLIMIESYNDTIRFNTIGDPGQKGDEIILTRDQDTLNDIEKGYLDYWSENVDLITTESFRVVELWIDFLMSKFRPIINDHNC